MSQQDMDDVIAFPKSLTDHSLLTNPAFQPVDTGINLLDDERESVFPLADFTDNR